MFLLTNYVYNVSFFGIFVVANLKTCSVKSYIDSGKFAGYELTFNFVGHWIGVE